MPRSDPPSINRGQIRHCHWASLSPHCPLYCFSLSLAFHFCFCESLLNFWPPLPPPSCPLSFSIHLTGSTSLHQSTLQHQSLSTPPTSSWINCQFSIHETSPQFPKRSERGDEMKCVWEREEGGGGGGIQLFLSLLRTQTSCPLSSLGN